ncbi:MAG TPA: alpha/beta fold hydrolase [Candidatus Limnocylindria bacterium]|nr:alpha/beta fold hydrolase [Candidatus Limnocylindria bacterium]
MAAFNFKPTAFDSIDARATPLPSLPRRRESGFPSGWNLARSNDVFRCAATLALFIASSCATVGPLAVAQSRQTTVELTPCTFARHKEAALCGKHQVYENREAKTGRKIALNIVVLPARSSAAKTDPVFYLAGGPGQAAARIASAGEDAIMRELRRERDLVFVDMRGTGDSNGLQCDFPADPSKVQSFFGEFFELAVIQACREKLERIADLKYYNTPLGVDDLEEVRLALGYDKINLYGVSHGSQATLEYLRRYPDAVRSAVLAGVATPAAKLPLQFAQGAEQAMTRLFEDCAADDGCNTAFPQLMQRFAQLMQSFDNGPVELQVAHPATKAVQTATLSRGVFVVRLLALLYNHRTAGLLPLIIANAAQGDWSAFMKILARSAAPPAFRVYLGAYLSATCSESVPLIDDQALVRATAHTFMGEYRTNRHQQACAHWPRGEIAPHYYQPVRAATAVLMLSGDIDPATPAAFGAQALETLPNGRQVVLRNTPHSYESSCARALILTFIASGSATELDTRCAARLRRPPFATELPASYK